MKDSGTSAALLEAARQLFARQGFKGSSVRAITAAAGANLGAVTYHFGSKEALYNAVLEEATARVRARVRDAAAQGGSPLERIERVVRALFEQMVDAPELPRLVLQVLAVGDRLPQPVERTMRANIQRVSELIGEGQRDGSIRPGDPRHLALSVGSQPIFLGLLRQALHQAVALDQDDPATRRDVVDSVARFVRRGLQANAEVTA